MPALARHRWGHKGGNAFSKPWKKPLKSFQGLDKLVVIFPKPRKNRRFVFQSLEHRVRHSASLNASAMI